MARAQISKFILLMIHNFLTVSTFSFVAILIGFLTMPKVDVNTCPLFFGKVCVPKNNFRIACSKDDVNTPSAILHVLRTTSIYWPLLV